MRQDPRDLSRMAPPSRFMPIDRFVLSCLLLTLFGLAASRVHSFDIFWQLQSGKYILQTKSFIYTDIFTLAADVDRWEHCWLHDIIFYGTYQLAGYAGISLLKGLLVAATAWTLVLAARLRGASWLAILCLAPPALLLTRGGWLERPQLWTFLFFSLFVLILEHFRRTGSRVVYLLLPLMVVWANLHGGAVLAFPVVFAYLAGEGVALLRRRSSLSIGSYYRLLWVMLGMALAALVTPYGFMLLKTLVLAPSFGGGEAPLTQIFNMDWRTTSFVHDPLFFYLLGIVSILLLVGWRKVAWTDLFLIAGLALMGLKLSRHTTFLFFAGAAILPVYADAAVLPFQGWFKGKVGQVLRMALVVASVGVFLAIAAPTYKSDGFFSLGLRQWHYPVEATEFVVQHKLAPNIYNTYDWGGYLMWQLYPDYLVFWDGRQDSPEMFQLGLQVMRGAPGWDDVLERFGVNTVVTKACTVDTGQHYPLIDRLRESAEWEVVFTDESSLVFVRASSVAGNWLKKHRVADSRIDDTILSEATLLTEHDPRRYQGHWERARIFIARKQYPQAFAALEKHLSYAPPGKVEPAAERYYRMLSPMMRREG